MSEQPHLRVVRGDPTPEELAALTALVTATAQGGAPAPVPPRRGRWNDPAHAHRKHWHPGPGAWQAAAR